MKLRIIAVLLVMAALTATAYGDYKADVVMTTNAGTGTGKIFLKGDMSRTELTNGSMIIITRPDKGICWMLSPKTKTYTEFPARQPAGRKSAQYASMPGAKRLGSETVNGYQCDKYQIVTKGKVVANTTVWVSDKLNEVLKIISQSPGRTSSMEVRNIKKTWLLGKTFEVPKGYTKAPASAQVPMRR